MINEVPQEIWISRIRNDGYDVDPKVVNNIVLGHLMPEIFPQVIVAASMPEHKVEVEYPVQNLNGTEWFQFFAPIKTQIEIGITALEQLSYIHQKYGIVIRDRNNENILMQRTDQETSIFYDSDYWRVWQIDTGMVYDSVTDKPRLNLNGKFEGRSNIVQKNPELTSRYIAAQTESILDNISYHSSIPSPSWKDFFWRDKQKEANTILHNYCSYIKNSYKSRNFQELSYENTLQFLYQFRKLIE